MRWKRGRESAIVRSTVSNGRFYGYCNRGFIKIDTNSIVSLQKIIVNSPRGQGEISSVMGCYDDPFISGQCRVLWRVWLCANCNRMYTWSLVLLAPSLWINVDSSLIKRRRNMNSCWLLLKFEKGEGIISIYPFMKEFFSYFV